MNDYILMTDSSADLPDKLVRELNLEVLPLTFVLKGKNYKNWPDNREMAPKAFYRQLREGAVATTAAVNVADVVERVEPLLQQGKDVLLLSFSSGLSATCDSARIAAQELGEQYPERKFFVVDTLCASLGQGLLVWHAARRRERGDSIEAVRDWVEENKLHLCHWFTVDDLMYLKRGGRLNAATALVGTALGIKPVLHIDDDGHLINVGKARGRRGALTALVDRMAELAVDPEKNPVFISHGDCLDDAKMVEKLVKQRLGVKEVVISYVGPVIGAHTGPGVVALFFLGRER